MAATKYTVEVSDSSFESTVLQSDKPVLVDFWAQWCGPCLAVAPVLEELAEEYQDNFIIAKVDVDKNPESASKFGVMNIPTLLFFKGGEIVDKQVGAAPKKTFKAKMDALLA